MWYLKDTVEYWVFFSLESKLQSITIILKDVHIFPAHLFTFKFCHCSVDVTNTVILCLMYRKRIEMVFHFSHIYLF